MCDKRGEGRYSKMMSAKVVRSSAASVQDAMAARGTRIRNSRVSRVIGLELRFSDVLTLAAGRFAALELAVLAQIRCPVAAVSDADVADAVSDTAEAGAEPAAASAASSASITT